MVHLIKVQSDLLENLYLSILRQWIYTNITSACGLCTLRKQESLCMFSLMHTETCYWRSYNFICDADNEF